jgi:hypothetical protein
MRKHVTLYALLILLPTGRAFAQETPGFNIGMGYAFVRASRYDENFAPGFWFSVNYNMNNRVGITGELSYASGPFDQYICTVATGPKVTFRVAERVEPFVRVFVGVSERLDFFGDYLDQARYFALQPGGGIDVALRTWMAVRAAVDYGIIFEPHGSEHQLRVTAGVAFRTGRKK